MISNASRVEAHSSYTLNNGQKTGYGYGWGIGNIQESPRISHGGGINGFLTSSIYLLNEDLFVAVFSNCNCNAPGGIATKMAAIAIGKPYEWGKISLSDDLLKSYLAVYESEYDKERIITFKDGKLFSMRTGGSKYEIYPFEKDKIFFEDGTTTLHFNRESNNEIVSVISKSTGYNIKWKRTDKPIPSITEIELDDSTKEKYVGKYQFTPYFHINIFIDENKMFTQATGQNRIEIIPFEENKFTLVDVDAKITFNLDENGKVDSMTLHQNGEKNELE